jgi:hypothetical protein
MSSRATDGSPHCAPAFDVVQLAFIVPDLDEAMTRVTALGGYGPWFVLRRIHVPAVRYRGRPATFTHSAAPTQAGAVQVELIEQHDAGASAYREFVPEGDTGFHHTAIFVPSFHDAVASYAAAGFELVQEYDLPDGKHAGFVDTRALNGHFLEVLEDSVPLRDLYATVAALGDAHPREAIVEAGDVAALLR